MVDNRRRAKVFAFKREALEWETAQRQAPQASETTTHSISLLEWATKYLEYSLTVHQRKVFEEKRYCFKRLFAEFNPDTPVTSIAKRDALDYLLKQAKKRSGNAANRERKNLLAAWNWAAEYLDFPSESPFKVRRLPEVRHPRYTPPLCDFWKVYEAAEDCDKVLLLTFLYTAARKGEVFRLTWEDIDFQNNKIRLSTRKRAGGNLESDWVEMVQDLRSVLLWWWENRPAASRHVFTIHGEHNFDENMNGQPFTQRQHFMRKLCRRAEVKPFGFHAIRHLTASLLDQGGKELTLIQKVLRHQNPHTTARYLHSLRGVRAELEAVLPKPPGKVIQMVPKAAAG
jgi:integrase